MARYYVEMDALKEEGKMIKDYAINTVGAKFEELMILSKSLNWSGPSSEIFQEMFERKIKRLSNISGMIQLFGNFMISASEGFTNVNHEIELTLPNVVEENTVN